MSNGNGTAVTQRDDVARFKAILAKDGAKAHITPFLPEGVSYERVMAGVQLAAMQNPAILTCTAESIVLAVAKIQQWGLEAGVTAHLVPFGKTLTPIADYKGIAQLMIASRAVRHVEAHCVYAHDQFDYQLGSDAHLTHVPVTDHAKRGALKGAYVILHLPFGMRTFEYMPVEEIDAIRLKHSKQWKSGPCPPWYARKTVVRQVAKLVPQDARMAKVLAVIEDDRAAEFGGIETPAALPEEDDVPRLMPVREGRMEDRSRTVSSEEYGGSSEIPLDPDAMLAAGEQYDGDEFQDDRDLDTELPLGDTRRRAPTAQEGGR